MRPAVLHPESADPLLCIHSDPTMLALEPVKVDTGSSDEQGYLVHLDGRLVAVLVRLDSEAHGELRGCWNLEAAFGRIASSRPPPFADLEEAKRWIEAAIGR